MIRIVEEKLELLSAEARTGSGNALYSRQNSKEALESITYGQQASG